MEFGNLEKSHFAAEQKIAWCTMHAVLVFMTSLWRMLCCVVLAVVGYRQLGVLGRLCGGFAWPPRCTPAPSSFIQYFNPKV